LAGRRDEVVVATKFHGAMGRDPNMAGNSRRWIVRAFEAAPPPPPRAGKKRPFVDTW
jgi:hypothetical protein